MLSTYKLNKIEKNLEYFYNESLKDERNNGINWYKDANNFCKDLSSKYNLDTQVIASVLSALSPRNKWEQNKKDTIKVIEAHLNNVSPEDVKVCTFHTNKFKAFDILKGAKVIEYKSRKTYSFVMNVGKLDYEFVTVDVWHLRACFDKMIIKKSVTPLEYDQIVEVTKNVAKKYGLKGFEFQAIVWEQIRNNF